jgi:hypothetical protein
MRMVMFADVLVRHGGPFVDPDVIAGADAVRARRSPI